MSNRKYFFVFVGGAIRVTRWICLTKSDGFSVLFSLFIFFYFYFSASLFILIFSSSLKLTSSLILYSSVGGANNKSNRVDITYIILLEAEQ